MANKTFDYGDLRISMTSNYGWVWDDTGSGATRSVCLWTPSSQGDLFPLGDYAQPGSFFEIGGKRASLLVGQNPNTRPTQPAVARPIDYTQIWGDWGSGGKHDGRIWRPVAPAGYVALGDVGSYGYSSKPSVNKIWCVRQDLVGYGKFLENSTWTNQGSGASLDVSFWAVHPNSIGVEGAECLPVLADTFRAYGNYSRPSGDEARVLLLPAPKNYDRFRAPAPQLEATKIPSAGDQFNSKEQCKLTLPFNYFFAPTHQGSLDNISNPFLTVSRSIAWIAEGVWVNNTDGTITGQQTMKLGVSEEKREEMTHSVGVEISAPYGIELSSVSVSLNYQFEKQVTEGLDAPTHTSTPFTEYSEKQVAVTFDVPAHTASVLFAKHIWVRASRLDSPVVIDQTELISNDQYYFSSCNI
ncbi:putative vacuolar protein sorting-associated protein [Xylaria longipes]|nr:putative vacuolar protein sorting-associated protein [Xylaria longipes]